MNNSRLADSIAKAANFLDEKQLYNGEFRSYRADNEALQGSDLQVDSSIFVASCILYSLSFLDTPAFTTMRRSAFRFLAEQMRPPGIWQYFASGYAIQAEADLDDTACASFLLKFIHPDIKAGRNLDIILGNTNEDGLFLTWLRKKGEPNDVDSVVNANVLLYLGDREETKVVSDYLNRIIAGHRESESYYYYLDDIALYYAVSRAHFNGVISLEPTKDYVIPKIEARQRTDGSFGSELLTALAVCSLLNFSCDNHAVLSRGVESLMDTQQRDGSWPRRAYYGGPLPQRPCNAWYGSEELTTGFCLEALARFQAVSSLK
jgi:hypothetical protein